MVAVAEAAAGEAAIVIGMSAATAAPETARAKIAAANAAETAEDSGVWEERIIARLCCR